MKKEISDLVEISNYYGKNKEYVIAGGGNTSYKDKKNIWVKASGTSLSDIDENGFVCLSRELLKVVSEKVYSPDTAKREQQVKEDMASAIVTPKHLRPSVETSMHEIIAYDYVVHTHPSLVNALMCCKNAERLTTEIFRDGSIYIEYTDPGYILFKTVLEKLSEYEAAHQESPKVIFLQNHGVFVGSDSIDEIKSIYQEIESRLGERIHQPGLDSTNSAIALDDMESIITYFSGKELMVRGFTSELIRHFSSDRQQYLKISRPFTPDIIVYCKSNYLFLEQGISDSQVYSEIDDFKQQFGYDPKVILMENKGLVIVEENEKNVNTVADVFIDMMKISLLSENFGGPNFMTPEQIDFIDHWEVENYRRKVSRG